MKTFDFIIMELDRNLSLKTKIYVHSYLNTYIIILRPIELDLYNIALSYTLDDYDYLNETEHKEYLKKALHNILLEYRANLHTIVNGIIEKNFI